jgi:hypothetical protein
MLKQMVYVTAAVPLNISGLKQKSTEISVCFTQRRNLNNMINVTVCVSRECGLFPCQYRSVVAKTLTRGIRTKLGV